MLLSNFYLEIYFWYYFTAFPRLTQSWKFTELSFSGSKWWNLSPVEPLITIYNCLKFLKKKMGERIAYPVWKCLYLTCLRDNIAIMRGKKKREKERKKKKTDKTKYYNSIAFYCRRLVRHWCSYHILKSCAIYYWTDTWQNGVQRKIFSSCHKHGTKKRFWVSTKNDIHNVLVHHRIPMAQW